MEHIENLLIFFISIFTAINVQLSTGSVLSYIVTITKTLFPCGRINVTILSWANVCV